MLDGHFSVHVASSIISPLPCAPHRFTPPVFSSSGSNRPRVPAAATTTSRRRPTFARRPYIRREQAPTWTKPETPTFISAYDNSNNNNNYRDTSRGLQTLASSSRGGLVDRTFSRGVEANNRLQTFERPVERRPVLTIGTGGSGNEYEWTISGLTECSRTCGGGKLLFIKWYRRHLSDQLKVSLCCR